MERNASEERAYNLLIKLGFTSEKISEPDKVKSNTKKAPDFLVEKVAIEVKEIAPKAEELVEIAELKRLLIEEKRTISYWTPIPRDQFVNDINEATQKFKNYPNYATVLVEDISQWFPKKPGMDTMMFGNEAIHIDAKTNNMVGRSWQQRILQAGLRRTVGTYVFLMAHDTAIYHNLHAKYERKLPKKHMEMFKKNGFDQYSFYYDKNNRPITMYLAGDTFSTNF